MPKEQHPVPGEGNMVYPKDKKEPVQGEIKNPKKGLQEKDKDSSK